MNAISPRLQFNFSQTLTNATREQNGRNSLLLAAILCSSIQLFGIAGNALVIHAISTQRRFQTDYYYLAYHLAVSDLIVLLTFTDQTLYLWLPSLPLLTTSVMCKLYYFVQVVFYTSGVVFLLSIGLVRYRGIVHPFKVKLTRSQLRCVVIAGYLGSLLVSTPYSMSFQNKNNRCVLTHKRYYYNVVMTLLTFFVNFLAPVVALHVLYLKIVYQLWVQQQTFVGDELPRTASRRQGNNMRCSNEVQAKQRRFSRAVFVSFVVVVLFSLCSAPFEILWLVDVVVKAEISRVPTWAFLIKLLGTCAVNAFIYGVADSGLKQSFRQTFRRIMKCCKR